MIQHDVNRWGPLRAALPNRPRLVRVLSLILELSAVAERAKPDAANIIVNRLSGLQLFMLDSNRDAEPVGSALKLDRVWPTGCSPIFSFWDVDPEASPGGVFCGQAGALDWMRKFWVDQADLSADWDQYAGAGLAVLEGVAMPLFPELYPCEAESQVPGGALMEGLGIIQPGGGTWPHVKGLAWSDAERIAMFKMRHKNKMTGDAIGVVVGFTRTRIDEQIGPQKLVGRWKDNLPWVSAELCTECGILLQPLQSPLQSVTHRLR